MAQVATFCRDQLGEAVDDEIAFAPVARRAAERQPRLAGDRRGEAVLEVGRHVAGEEQPRAGTHALRVVDVGASDADGSDRLDVGHGELRE